MSIYTWLDYRSETRNALMRRVCQCKNKYIQRAVNKMQDLQLAIEQEENYLWYKGNSDYLMWFYSRGIVQNGLYNIMNQYLAHNWVGFYWTTSACENGIKRTHSGLPRQTITFIDRAIGDPMFKLEDKAQNNQLERILQSNNALSTFSKQKRLDAVIGDGAFVINIDSELSEHPILEYVDGRDCQYEFVGDKITAVLIFKRYEVDGEIYTCVERRTTERHKNLIKSGFKTYSIIEYTLFRNDSERGFVECKLDSIEQTKGLKERNVYDLPFMLAIPCMREIDDETKRGVSMFRGRVDIFDDLDQSLSMESNTLRASTPVEYMDENTLEHDDDGKAKKPSVYGKQFILYKGASSYSEQAKGITTVFYNIDFSKLSVESQENVSRALNGWISPASFGFDVSRKDNALAQREKEKITIQTLKDYKEYLIPIYEDLAKCLIACDNLMRDRKYKYEEIKIEVKFKDYATPTLSEKINEFKDAVLSGVLSVDRFITECYGDESQESQDKEKEALLQALQKNKFNFNFSEGE